MPQIILIEPEDRHTKAVAEVVKSLGDKFVLFHYTDANEFYRAVDQVKHPNEQERETDKKGPRLDLAELALIIGDVKANKMISLGLWQKILKMLEGRGKEHSVQLILTAFDDHEASFEGTGELVSYIDTAVFNIVLKPFDQLLLKQNILLALKGKGPLAVETLYSYESNAKIEIIKEIETECLTELGFRTISSREIEIGKIARYYGQPFEWSEHNSVFAYCYDNHPHEIEGKFSCGFSYIGIANEQLSAIRRNITKSKDKSPLYFSTDNLLESSHALVFSRDRKTINALENLLEEKFEGLQATSIEVLSDLIRLLPVESQGEFSSETGSGVLGTDEEVSLVFDQEMRMVKAPDFFKSKISGSHRFLFEETVSKKKIEKGTILEIQVSADQSHYIELLSLDESIDADHGNAWVLVVRELSSQESIEHVKKEKGEIENVNLVFFDTSFSPIETIGSIKKMVEMINQKSPLSTKYISISEKPLKGYEDIKSVSLFDDHFLFPLDLFYTSRKVKMHLPMLKLRNKEDGSRLKIPLIESIKTALPVEIKSVSEVHISISYSRPIEVGKIRRFILFVPNLKNMPEILAVCRHSQELEKGKYQCDFLFFAVNESALKYIRQWIKEQYVAAKSAKGE